MSEKYVALLRGINVGGRNKLPMQGLKAIFERVGARETRTYIQSGNVVFETASAASAAELAEAVRKGIEEDFGYSVPVVLRSEDELRRVAGAHPFDGEGVEAKNLHVGFLDHEPDEGAVARLDPERSPPDVFVVRGREIFLHYPNGSGRSKLTNAYFDSALGGVGTFRNWRTVGKLVSMLDG